MQQGIMNVLKQMDQLAISFGLGLLRIFTFATSNAFDSHVRLSAGKSCYSGVAIKSIAK
jgi:hypothetical protein